MIRIALLDKHRLFRVSLQSFIDNVEGVTTVISSENIQLVQSYIYHEKVDVLIVDPDGFDEDFSAFIIKAFPAFNKVRIVFLTDEIRREDIIKASEMGAFGFFGKEDDPSEFRNVFFNWQQSDFDETMKIGTVIEKCLIEGDTIIQESQKRLSEREIEILEMVCIEKTNVEISKELGVSVRTIESHRRRMIEKLDCKNIIGVILIAINDNLLTLPSCA